MTKLRSNLSTIFQSIICELENKRITPSLILISSIFDILGWLSSSEEFASSKSFIQWIKTYLLPYQKLDCSAIDLYAARCGLIHTFSPHSKLSEAHKARKICWAWGNTSLQDLKTVIQKTKKEDVYVAVHVNDLVIEMGNAVDRFLEELIKNPERLKLAEEKANNFFEDFPSEIMTKLAET
jgi:hypothetical protein